MILLTADLLELKANPTCRAKGVVLEAKKEVGRGIVATVLVQDGTLNIGDPFFSGTTYGRVRAMTDERGKRIKEAGPATPVQLTGFDDVPNAGDSLQVVDDDTQARMIGQLRQEKAREAAQAKGSRMSLDQLFQRMQQGDGQGTEPHHQGGRAGLGRSAERHDAQALHRRSEGQRHPLLGRRDHDERRPPRDRLGRDRRRLQRPPGAERRRSWRRRKASTSACTPSSTTWSTRSRLAMTGLLDPKFQEVFQGRAEVRDTFKVPKAGVIAGCMVTDGVIPRTASVRLLRDNRVIFEGKIGSLRHFKNDVSEVRQGFECGIGIERFQDIKVGDIIEAFKIEKMAAAWRNSRGIAVSAMS